MEEKLLRIIEKGSAKTVGFEQKRREATGAMSYYQHFKIKVCLLSTGRLCAQRGALGIESSLVGRVGHRNVAVRGKGS